MAGLGCCRVHIKVETSKEEEEEEEVLFKPGAMLIPT
jgi:hypothetical protein